MLWVAAYIFPHITAVFGYGIDPRVSQIIPEGPEDMVAFLRPDGLIEVYSKKRKARKP
jgi:hypothetical protein